MSDNNNNSGGRSLGGGPAEPLPSSWSQPNSERRIGRIGDLSSSSGASGRGGSSSSGPRIRTMGELTGGGASSGQGGHGHSHDDSDDDDDEEGESWFAGGERSGINVQNPDRRGGGAGGGVPGGNMVRDLLRRAAEAGPPPTAEGGSRTFTGGGHRLGSDEVDSSYIPDPTATDRQEPIIRHLTFWREGFTVEDGELMRYDDPNNESILAEIHAGRAPPSLLNVQTGDPVELRVARRVDEDYVPPKRGAFSGSGNRLGAPVPDLAGAGSSSSTMPGSFTPSAAQPSSSQAAEPDRLSAKFEVDQSKPMTSVQIRLADGTRMVCRMNLTHTVLDLRNFINASRPENLTRSYSIGTTFPNRTLDDDSATIEGAGLKNSVVVQKWD